VGKLDKGEVADLWRRRLTIPVYRIGEAAAYAHTTTQTAARWHRKESQILTTRTHRTELSYMQLIELAVVAAMRQEGVKLKAIRAAREYASSTLKCEFPFAEYKFKTDGVELIVEYADIEPNTGIDKLLYASRGGQLGWKEVLDRRLREFEYEDGGVVIRWRVNGENSDVIIDPRVSFGTPSINGTATWAIKGRWNAGESIGDIVEDFGLQADEIVEALKFEGIRPAYDRQNLWAS